MEVALGSRLDVASSQIPRGREVRRLPEKKAGSRARPPQQLPELKELGHRRVLESPLSVIKMDVSELQNFTSRVNDFINSPGPAAIRICECCIQIS